VDANVSLSELHLDALARCTGGEGPDPPLDGFPGLCWQKDHPRFGNRVFAADQRASVEELAGAILETPDYEGVAAKWGTRVEYVEQAVDYAIRATFHRASS
jgi:hypothetical protein